ncbi:conserved hypothetical protein [Perkinsus marinus ATCC 50983]|uniref:TP53-regulated inhibitor of apoptosis n=1 Tax=Perkinsus marinus (strain ATCC 50983 / TXsc) TaxID=423536 RepID=C5KD47_PERM5|nr:conserved hypothetical protein [Perkinsus marinus ATCC 50983]EER17796.1 conserved hypothetical protein [Perkinsus marinus ATCC 50983]|eukprot:XP_002786000.1 conserved hypothetical protein [Perkinsus marinus ATCC 50983]
MGWLWGGKKEDNGSAEKDSNKEATTSKEATSAARVEEVDPNDGRKVADAHKEAIQSCKHLKDRYDQCFNNWYRHAFLRGDLALSCDEYFEEYRACLVEDMEARGLGHLCMFGPDKPADFDEGDG